MWEYKRKVNYYETDRMGVVHHSNYLRFLEEARMQWIEDHLMDYHKMEQMGIIIPAVNAAGNFIAYLRHGDTFSIRMKIEKFTGVRMQFAYEVYNAETGELCYNGTTSHCFVSAEGYRPFSLKKKFPELYKAFSELTAENQQ